MKTVLITGCSSGFGLEIAKYFLERNWKVVATMRTPREGILPPSENLRILPLDVTKPESIDAAITAAGPIDVLVNNAGIGLLNAVEGVPMDVVHEIFPGTPVVAAGYARPSTAPGWGVDLDEKLAAEHPPVLGGHERWAATVRRPDGSIEAP